MGGLSIARRLPARNVHVPCASDPVVDAYDYAAAAADDDNIARRGRRGNDDEIESFDRLPRFHRTRRNVVIDATCGNGRDLLALAEILFPRPSDDNEDVDDDENDLDGGRLIGIDVQSRDDFNDGEGTGRVRTMVTRALERVVYEGAEGQTWRAFVNSPLGRPLSPVLAAATRIK